jgi:uncharacterized oligopeptide transporter (OPT) family protein
MWMIGENSKVGAVAVVLIGAVVCSAAAVAGDNLQDLKAGQIVMPETGLLEEPTRPAM